MRNTLTVMPVMTLQKVIAYLQSTEQQLASEVGDEAILKVISKKRDMSNAVVGISSVTTGKIVRRREYVARADMVNEVRQAMGFQR